MVDFSTLPAGWGFTLYAIEPSDPITLELYPPDGSTVTITGQDADQAWDAAEQVFRAATAPPSLVDLLGGPDAPAPANDPKSPAAEEPDPFA